MRKRRQAPVPSLQVSPEYAGDIGSPAGFEDQHPDGVRREPSLPPVESDRGVEGDESLRW